MHSLLKILNFKKLIAYLLTLLESSSKFSFPFWSICVKKIKAIKPESSVAIKTTSFFPSSVHFTMFKAERRRLSAKASYHAWPWETNSFYQHCIDKQYYAISPAKREWKQRILMNCIQPLNQPGSGIKTRRRHDSPSYGTCAKPHFFFAPQRTL